MLGSARFRGLLPRSSKLPDMNCVTSDMIDHEGRHVRVHASLGLGPYRSFVVPCKCEG